MYVPSLFPLTSEAQLWLHTRIAWGAFKRYLCLGLTPNKEFSGVHIFAFLKELWVRPTCSDGLRTTQYLLIAILRVSNIILGTFG